MPTTGTSPGLERSLIIANMIYGLYQSTSQLFSHLPSMAIEILKEGFLVGQMNFPYLIFVYRTSIILGSDRI